MKKIGVIFPGYPSQFVGMSKDLYDKYRVVQELFEEASNCLPDVNFVKLIFASSDIEISKLSNAYTSLFLVGASVYTVLENLGLKPDLIAGYGVGEYSAVYAGGGISLPDGLYFLNKLANFFDQNMDASTMSTVCVNGVSGAALKKICNVISEEDCSAAVSVYRNNKESVVTGHTDAVQAVVETVAEIGIKKCRTLSLEEGLHTVLATDVFDQLKIYLNKIDFKDMKYSLISNVGAKVINFADQIENALMNQIIEPINWNKTLSKFNEMDYIITICPSKFLTQEVKKYYPDKQIIGIENCADLESDIFKQILGVIDESVVSGDLQQNCQDSI